MNVLQQLLAIQEIQQLEAKRVRTLDTKDWSAYATLHIPEMEHTYGGGSPAFGIEDIVKKLQNRLQNSLSVHHIHSPEITVMSRVTARAIWAMEDSVLWQLESKCLHGYGHYFCDYTFRDGRWLISARILRRIWAREGDTRNCPLHSPERS